MADLVIRGMKMPMSCLVCPLAREMFGCLVCVGYFKDSLTGRRVYKSDLKESDADFNRPEWCPILPLPEEHGRCIDADEISGSLAESATFNYNKRTSVCWSDAFLSMIDMLDDAPTIVPAEGGENE